MPDNGKHIYPSDEFSDLIRNKLEEHRMPVDDDCWEGIENRLKPKKNKYILWIGGAVASIAVLLVYQLSTPSDSLPFHTNMTKFNSVNIPPKMENRVVEKDIITQPSKSISVKSIAVGLSPKNEDGDGESVRLPELTVDTVYIAQHSDNKADTADVIGVSDKDILITETIGEEKVKITSEEKEPERILLAKKKDNSSKWLIAASFSSAGNNDKFDNNGVMYNDFNSGGNSSSSLESFFKLYKENAILSDDNYSSINHSLPLSFGLTVRKGINKYIGIETGLVYTYLSSQFRSIEKPYHEVEQKLHYLGVPLNLVVNLPGSKQWNFYLSAGGMGEKGIRYATKWNMYSSDIAYDKDAKGTVNGLQWSVNASVGVSYSIYKQWGVYIEPRLSHYFDNNQPISIRTEKSTVFSIGGGIRYGF